MKKIFLVLVTLLISGWLHGQAPFPTAEEIKQFTVSATCVVLEDNPFSQYNPFIKDAVQKYWKVTPFQFINRNEFNQRRKDPAYSFIVLTETDFERDKSGSVFTFINLLQGKNVKNLEEMPEICAIPLAFAGEEDIEYAYKLGAILSFMQNHARLIAEDPSLTGRKYLKYYNKFVPEVVNKTILIKKGDLDPAIGTIEKVKAVYPHKIEIVDEEAIIKAITEKSPNTVILHKVGPVGEKKNGYCFKMLIGTDDANMYYYDQHLIDKKNPNGFLISDLKRLARF
jgi:hypothetical protein